MPIGVEQDSAANDSLAPTEELRLMEEVAGKRWVLQRAWVYFASPGHQQLLQFPRLGSIGFVSSVVQRGCSP